MSVPHAEGRPGARLQEAEGEAGETAQDRANRPQRAGPANTSSGSGRQHQQAALRTQIPALTSPAGREAAGMLSKINAFKRKIVREVD